MTTFKLPATKLKSFIKTAIKEHMMGLSDETTYGDYDERGERDSSGRPDRGMKDIDQQAALNSERDTNQIVKHELSSNDPDKLSTFIMSLSKEMKGHYRTHTEIMSYVKHNKEYIKKYVDEAQTDEELIQLGQDVGRAANAGIDMVDDVTSSE